MCVSGQEGGMGTREGLKRQECTSVAQGLKEQYNPKTAATATESPFHVQSPEILPFSKQSFFRERSHYAVSHTDTEEWSLSKKCHLFKVEKEQVYLLLWQC